MLAVMNIFRRLFSDVFENKGFKNSKFPVYIRHKYSYKFYMKYCFCGRHAMAQLVEALGYKQEGRGFDSRWCH
jgi:hypothetical protein